MKLVSEYNRMYLEIVDIFEKESQIFLLLKHGDFLFDVSVENVKKSMEVGDWKITDLEPDEFFS